MTISTYAPAFSRPTNPAQDIATDAMRRWPEAPAAALRAHLFALREIWSRCPAVSRRGAFGEKQEAHHRHIEQAIGLLESDAPNASPSSHGP